MGPNKVSRERPDLRLIERRVISAIEKKRYRLGFSVQHVADKSNMYRSTLTNVLKQNTNIELVEFLSICGALGLNPAPLLQQCVSGKKGVEE